MKTVFYGNAEIGNDLPSLGFPDYADGIPSAPTTPGAPAPSSRRPVRTG